MKVCSTSLPHSKHVCYRLRKNLSVVKATCSTPPVQTKKNFHSSLQNLPATLWKTFVDEPWGLMALLTMHTAAIFAPNEAEPCVKNKAPPNNNSPLASLLLDWDLLTGRPLVLACVTICSTTSGTSSLVGNVSFIAKGTYTGQQIPSNYNHKTVSWYIEFTSSKNPDWKNQLLDKDSIRPNEANKKKPQCSIVAFP